MNYKEVGAIIRAGLLMGYLKGSDIVKWAEKDIRKSKFEDFQLDICCARSDNEILSFLKEGIGESEELNNVVFKYFLSYYNYLLQEMKIDYLIIQKEIIRFDSINELNITDAQKLFFSRLNNDYSLRKIGLTAPMDLPKELLSFLNEFYLFSEIRNEFYRKTELTMKVNEK